MSRAPSRPSAVRLIRARRELHALATLIATALPEGELEQMLSRLHPHAVRDLSARELAAIAAVASRPIREP